MNAKLWKALAKKLWREREYNHTDCIPVDHICPICNNWGWSELDWENPKRRVYCTDCNYEWNFRPESEDEVEDFFEGWEKDLKSLVNRNNYKIRFLPKGKDSCLLGGIPVIGTEDHSIGALDHSFIVEYNMKDECLEIKYPYVDKPEKVYSSCMRDVVYYVRKHYELA